MKAGTIIFLIVLILGFFTFELVQLIITIKNRIKQKKIKAAENEKADLISNEKKDN